MFRVPPRQGGWLEVICGPMFSGKSEEMIRRLRRAAPYSGETVVVGAAEQYEARCRECHESGVVAARAVSAAA